MALRERPQPRLVRVAQRLEMAEQQHRRALPGRDLDLRQALADGQSGDQFAQRRDQPGDRRRQHLAARHVGDEGRAPLAEAHQRAALAFHVAGREAGAAPVAPFLAVDDGQQALGLHLADAREAVLQPALLGGHLGAGVRVLGDAAAAAAEVGTARLSPAEGGLEDAGSLRQLELALVAYFPGLHPLGAEGALDEDDLALGIARDATALGVQRQDVQDFQRDRNSFQCGAFSFSSASRRSLHSLPCWASVSAPRSSWKRSHSR